MNAGSILFLLVEMFYEIQKGMLLIELQNKIIKNNSEISFSIRVFELSYYIINYLFKISLILKLIRELIRFFIVFLIFKRLLEDLR